MAAATPVAAVTLAPQLAQGLEMSFSVGGSIGDFDGARLDAVAEAIAIALSLPTGSTVDVAATAGPPVALAATVPVPDDPACSPLHKGPVHVIAAGGIHDGRGLAMALSLGASAVWVGTRFVASEEGDAPQAHKDSVVGAGYHDTVRTLVFSGRPMRIRKSKYVMDWEENRQQEMKGALAQGKLPYTLDENKGWTAAERKAATPWLMGQVAGAINEVKPAAAIVEEMVGDAIRILRRNAGLCGPTSKL